MTLAAFGFCLQHLRGTGGDWGYFLRGSELLFGQHHRYTPLPGGLHLYANYPEYQIGPLSFLVATPFRLLGPGNGRIPAVFVMTAAIPMLVWLLERTAHTLWRDDARFSVTLLQSTTLVGGVVVAQAWSPLATIYSHLDDVMLLSAGIVALWAVAHRRPMILGAMIGVAIAAKPWGVVVLPLALALPGGRDRLKALALGGGIAAAAWLPFVIGDPGTLDAIEPVVTTSTESVLHLFGVAATDAPAWVRPVQLGAALLATGLTLLRGRWAAVLVVGIAVRVALDPQVFLYYSAGLLLAAFAWDMLRSPRALPIWTIAGFVLLNDAYSLVESDTGKAVLRLMITAAIIVSTAFLPNRPRRTADPVDMATPSPALPAA